MILKKIRVLFNGVSWKNPLIAIGLRILNPIDWFIRLIDGKHYLPKYSIRVRSNGLRSQFGGSKFYKEGKYIYTLLKKYTALTKSCDVLEIGCGCGRTAFSLAEDLEIGTYLGMDIEHVSLEACTKSKYLSGKGFQFEYMNVFNREYNPKGTTLAKNYSFPKNDECFDVIFLMSVFTHMLPQDVSNYISEISRMLKPGGKCMLSTFLMDQGTNGEMISFPYKYMEAFTYKEQFPEIAVGYTSSYFVERFKESNLKLDRSPLFGIWRGNNVDIAETNFPQDLLVFVKDERS